MLDLHCHILPGIDDGASSLEESLAMARFCVADGITHITATPHCNRSIRLLRRDILPHVARLNEELVRAAVPLIILPGSEIQVATSAEYRKDFDAGLFCHLGDSRAFTLLEFSWHDANFPPDAVALILWLRERDMTPIIAHPERQHFLSQYPQRLGELVDAGAWLQITVDSLLGNHGTMAQSSAEDLLQSHSDAVLATDAHNLQRCSGLSAGYTWVRDNLGEKRADELRIKSDAVLTALLRGGDERSMRGDLRAI